jgi:hypothetical protein
MHRSRGGCQQSARLGGGLIARGGEVTKNSRGAKSKMGRPSEYFSSSRWDPLGIAGDTAGLMVATAGIDLELNFLPLPLSPVTPQGTRR